LPASLRRVSAADESLLRPGSTLDLLSLPRPFGIFNIKLMKCGGIAPGMEIACMAGHAGIDLMWGCMDESIVSIAGALHAALACRATKYLDLDGSLDLARDIVTGGFIMENGWLKTTARPGLGVKRI
jgi:L-alanine-DL-glutamate epimerase-like enolase superfamily enzyme